MAEPKELECKRCGHKWFPRTAQLPKACPRCKHYDWQKDYWEVGQDEVKNKTSQLSTNR